MANHIYLGIGSNLNKVNALLFAKDELSKIVTDMSISSVYESFAVRQAEPNYYNFVIGAKTDLSVNELFEAISQIEQRAGEEPMLHNGTNFGFKHRVDIDILMYNDLVCTSPCKIPRHDIQDYPFVLAPLVEIAPDLLHPLLKIKVREIWDEMQPRLPNNMKVKQIEFDFSRKFNSWS